MVKERMKHLDRWERSKGHKWTEGEVRRNMTREIEVVFVCDACGKRCKSKGGLVVHRRRVHEASKMKKKFVCVKCGEEFMQDANRINHEKLCGGPSSSSDRKKCFCGREFSKGYIARHRKKCVAAREEEEREKRPPKKYKGQRCVCECGREMAKSNLARHKREACPLGEAGP